VRKQITVILSCGLLIAACGSSSKPAADAAKGGYPQALAFSRCMRAHGVAKFPDPSTNGRGIQLTIGPGSGVNPQDPGFRAAQKACGRLMPGGGPSSGHPSAQDKAQMLKVSQCMRSHGITDFPDPTTSQPSPGKGFGMAIGRNGVFLAIPNSIDVQSPAFKRAAAACNFGPQGAPPPPGKPQ
jgi:hypothetical protein